MRHVTILESADLIHPDDWLRPLMRSANFSSYSDAWHETGTYGGGPMDHLKWVPCWLSLGEVWWGRPYGNYISETNRLMEAVRGDIPDEHRFPLTVHNWHMRHPLFWEEASQKREVILNTVLTLPKHRGKTFAWVAEHDPGYLEWLAESQVPVFGDYARELNQLPESLHVYYRPKYREFIEPNATAQTPLNGGSESKKGVVGG